MNKKPITIELVGDYDNSEDIPPFDNGTCFRAIIWREWNGIRSIEHVWECETIGKLQRLVRDHGGETAHIRLFRAAYKWRVDQLKELGC